MVTRKIVTRDRNMTRELSYIVLTQFMYVHIIYTELTKRSLDARSIIKDIIFTFSFVSNYQTNCITKGEGSVNGLRAEESISFS